MKGKADLSRANMPETGIVNTATIFVNWSSICLLFLLSLLSACQNHKSQAGTTTIEPKADSTLVWTDYRLGELPPLGAYDGIDTLVKNYKLNYTRINAGCEIGDAEEAVYKKYEQQNQRYFKYLENRLGKDWKARFDAELKVLDSINWIKINRETDSLNKALGETQIDDTK